MVSQSQFGPFRENTKDLLESIDEKIGEVRLDALDMSFGELLSLHQNRELTIDPEYQRLFRWSHEQQSRLIESILLGLPIPQLFVIENDDGTLELIDGLQRLSSVIHFIQPELLPQQTIDNASAALDSESDVDESEESSPKELVTGNALQLIGCDILPELNSRLFNDLPLSLRLKIKRSFVRMTIIKKQSRSLLRYQMFKRLNSGGSPLSQQEIRNCTARIIGPTGIEFYTFLKRCAAYSSFRATTTLIPPSERSKKQDEELVLRFFALKDALNQYNNNITEFLTGFMEAVTVAKLSVDKLFDFDYDKEFQEFSETFDVLNRLFGRNAFLRFRNGGFFGGVAPTFFESFTIAVFRNLNVLRDGGRDNDVIAGLTRVREDGGFLANIGPGANSTTRLYGRIAAVEDAIRKALA